MIIYLKNKKKIFVGALIILVVLSISVKYCMIKYKERTIKRLEKENIVQITFREGLNIIETAELLDSNGVIKKKDFISACNSTVFLEEFGFLNKDSKDKYFILEGYLFPDTYEFSKNEGATSVIKKFLNNFKKKTSDLEIPNDFSLEHIITIASLLEAESTHKSVSKVSSVIHNRIKTFKNGGKNKFGEFGFNFLQIDPTIYYPYRNKSDAPNGFKSRYDTYSIKEFPPGPICSPGIEFIFYAINPEETDYFYFCSDPKGEMFFAKTFEEHNRNLKAVGLR